MAETNEIKTIKEEQKIIEGYEHPEPSEEGEKEFSHLTEEDLNADYKPQEEAEPAESSEEVSPETEASEEVKTEEDSSQQWDINGTTYKEGDMKDRMVKDYKNLVSFSGKQSEEIGGYKQRITELEAKLQDGNTKGETKEQEVESVETEDKDYDIYTKDGLLEMAQDIARKEIDRTKSEAAEEYKQQEFADASDKAREEFVKRHPEFSEEGKIVELIQFGSSKGIALGDATNQESITNYLETSYGMKTGDYSFFTEKGSSGQKEPSTKSKTMETVKEAQKVKPNLGNVNSTSTEVDYDTLTDDQWAKLPEEKRNELLGL